ncbi:hypothetical protein HDU96_010798 [Phlyctochytrium bullatum]|nr:hypothetical protein HDU96_010798 [Phlyctochytrium bullatum]
MPPGLGDASMAVTGVATAVGHTVNSLQGSPAMAIIKETCQTLQTVVPYVSAIFKIASACIEVAEGVTVLKEDAQILSQRIYAMANVIKNLPQSPNNVEVHPGWAVIWPHLVLLRGVIEEIQKFLTELKRQSESKKGILCYLCYRNNRFNLDRLGQLYNLYSQDLSNAITINFAAGVIGQTPGVTHQNKSSKPPSTSIHLASPPASPHASNHHTKPSELHAILTAKKNKGTATVASATFFSTTTVSEPSGSTSTSTTVVSAAVVAVASPSQTLPPEPPKAGTLKALIANGNKQETAAASVPPPSVVTGSVEQPPKLPKSGTLKAILAQKQESPQTYAPPELEEEVLPKKGSLKALLANKQDSAAEAQAPSVTVPSASCEPSTDTPMPGPMPGTLKALLTSTNTSTNPAVEPGPSKIPSIQPSLVVPEPAGAPAAEPQGSPSLKAILLKKQKSKDSLHLSAAQPESLNLSVSPPISTTPSLKALVKSGSTSGAPPSVAGSPPDSPPAAPIYDYAPVNPVKIEPFYTQASADGRELFRELLLLDDEDLFEAVADSNEESMPDVIISTIQEMQRRGTAEDKVKMSKEEEVFVNRLLNLAEKLKAEKENGV